jgi:hypothetical protein
MADDEMKQGTGSTRDKARLGSASDPNLALAAGRVQGRRWGLWLCVQIHMKIRAGARGQAAHEGASRRAGVPGDGSAVRLMRQQFVKAALARAA